MKILFSLVLLLSVLASSSTSFAATKEKEESNEDQIHVLIEPVIGYQSLERSYPIAHNEGMLTYGGRVVVGTYRLAGELEMQFGSASESFSNPTSSADTSFTLARLGVRTIVPLVEQLSLIFRVGMEGYHYSNNYNINGVTSSDSPAWQFRPYLGGGVNFFLFRSLSLSVEEIYVVDTSWETSFGFRLYI